MKQHGLSNTKARAQLFSSLVESDGPLSMNELAFRCKGIDRVSVYRIIEAFEKIGIVHRIQLGWKYKLELGDTFHRHHHHMTCLSCSKVIEFDEPTQLDTELEQIASKNSFTIQQHTLELRGICGQCKFRST